MTLIKYYKTNTCYDGQREFANANEDPTRHYPDEYLIANILDKYRRKRFPDFKNIIVLTEPWLSNVNCPTRDGGKNTAQINEQIIAHIELAEKDLNNPLILVPFLYGYHHPGITIDVKNKTAIYLDPFGTEAQYAEVIELQGLLKNKGFELLTVTTRQQIDGVNCGPILTASMIKFIEEFMAMGKISVNDFKAPRPNLGTERLFQMYVNNTSLDESEGFVDEIMLADEELWSKVFQEQQLSESIGQKVLDAMKKQKKFIGGLPHNWEKNPSQKLAVAFIKNFQSQITEYIFLKDQNIASKIDCLVAFSNQFFEQEHFIFDENCLTELFKKQDLLNTAQIAKTHSMLGLIDYPKTNVQPSALCSAGLKDNPSATPHKSVQSEDKPAAPKAQVQQSTENNRTFEKDKNEIQEHFKTSLNTLKEKLDSLAKNDVRLQEKGQTLFDSLYKKQEEFFKELTINSTEEEIAARIGDFYKFCAESVKNAEEIMGHGWLYRIVEVLIKAVVGLFAGIGMVLGSVCGQGLVKADHREKFAQTFFTLNQTEQSQALDTFKQKTLVDCEENQGLLSKFKKMR